MPSYRSLLILLLAASTVTPVLSVEPTKEFEGRASNQVDPVKRFNIGWGTGIKALLIAGLVTYSIKEWNPKPKQPPTSGTPPTNGTQPPSVTPPTNGTRLPDGNPPANENFGTQVTQQNYGNSSTNTVDPAYVNLASTYPSSVTSRKARREGRPLGRRSRMDISKARSFSDNNRRTSSDRDLFSRADLGEALSLFGRMLDKLD